MKIPKSIIITGAITLMFISFTTAYFAASGNKEDFSISAVRPSAPAIEAAKATPAATAEIPAEPVKINISKATREELMTLPGIGEAMADRIIEHRNQNGPFTIIEDITLVRGIGQGTFEKIQDFITVE